MSSPPLRLLAITPPRATAPRVDPGLVDAWLDAGAGTVGLAVLLREPGASAASILAETRLWPLREALAERGVPALLSVDPQALDPAQARALLERPDAGPRGIAGVQLRGDPSPSRCASWRESLETPFLIGRSVHGAHPRREDACDYTCLAPIYTPQTQLPGDRKQPIGLDALRTWAAISPPILALGGVSVATAGACIGAGAAGLAGIRLFFGPQAEARHNVGALVQRLR